MTDGDDGAPRQSYFNNFTKGEMFYQENLEA